VETGAVKVIYSTDFGWLSIIRWVYVILITGIAEIGDAKRRIAAADLLQKCEMDKVLLWTRTRCLQVNRKKWMKITLYRYPITTL